MLLCHTYYSTIAKTDNINVVNDAFENSLPKVTLPIASYKFKQRSDQDNTVTNLN